MVWYNAIMKIKNLDNMIDPGIKLMLQHKLWQLRYLAKERGINPNGTKLELATKLSKDNEEHSARMWRAIVDG